MAKRDDVEIEVKSLVAPARTLRVSERKPHSLSSDGHHASDNEARTSQVHARGRRATFLRVLLQRPTTLERWPNGVHPGMRLGEA